MPSWLDEVRRRFEAQDFPGLTRYLEEAVAAEPDARERARMRSLLAGYLFHEGRPQEAAECHRAALLEDPAALPIQVAAARFFLFTADDPASARALLEAFPLDEGATEARGRTEADARAAMTLLHQRLVLHAAALGADGQPAEACRLLRRAYAAEFRFYLAAPDVSALAFLDARGVTVPFDERVALLRMILDFRDVGEGWENFFWLKEQERRLRRERPDWTPPRRPAR